MAAADKLGELPLGERTTKKARVRPTDKSGRALGSVKQPWYTQSNISLQKSADNLGRGKTLEILNAVEKPKDKKKFPWWVVVVAALGVVVYRRIKKRKTRKR